MPNIIWRAVALLPAWRSDYIVERYVRWLLVDNARLRVELRSVRPGPYSLRGRRAAGLLMEVLTLGIALIFVILWWKYSRDSETLREGVREGLASARTR